MLIFVAIVPVILWAATAVVRWRRRDPAQLRTPRPPVPTMGVQIVCGDCAGDGPIAHRTYLDYSGACATCGGTSYVLASVLAGQTLLRRARAGAPAGGIRVVPIERGSRARQSKARG